MNIQKEMEIHSQLRGDYIIQFYGSFKEGKYVYLVLEFFDGPNLYILLKNRKFTLEQIKSIFHQCALALSYLHRQGVVMRDFKPENVLIDSKTLQIKLCDFGWASLISDKNWLCQMAGTYVYMAPESLQRQM